jgi:glycerate dehydrogenase
MSKGVFLDLASLHEADLDLSELRGLFDDWREYPATAPARRLAHIGEAEVVVANKVVLDADVLRAVPGLRLVCLTATGTNNVDLVAAAAQGVTVCNVRAYATDSVAQHVMALMLAHHTRLLDYHAAVRRGDWSHSRQFCLLDYPIRELRGMTLGIVGYGELGRGVERLARAFGMQILISQRPGGESVPGRLPLDEVLAQSDVVSLHVPLAPNTEGLIDARRLGLMRPHALLINTARGGVVDSRALAEALRAGTIGGAALDVLDEEPPPLDHPLLAGDLPNLILTPHTAWAGRQARQNVVDQTVANIRAWQAGRPQNVVTA